MAFIYKITNMLNGKAYIGKTYKSVAQRFKEHIREARKSKCANRPLYRAINKYGVHNFSVTTLEETDAPEEREVYWINFYNTFHNGYNATQGGDGKPYLDRNRIYSLFLSGCTAKEIADTLHYDAGQCRTILASLNISHDTITKRANQKKSLKVAQIDMHSNSVIAIYDSTQDAYHAINKQPSGHISAVCNGKRKQAYGYSWKYFN